MKRQRTFGDYNIGTTKTLWKKKETIVIDSDGELEVICLDSQNSVAEVKEELKEEILIVEDAVLCPMCSVDMTKWDLNDRETHCDTCLDGIKEEKFDVAPLKTESPKKLIHVVSPKKKSKKVKEEPEIPLGQISLTTDLSCSPVLESAMKRRSDKRKPLPFYKIIPFKSHKVVVDGFQSALDPSIQQYFLSHFHADHYMGVTKNWDHGIVYCTLTTKNLLMYKFKMPSERIIAMALNVKYKIHETVYVTLLDANHCPGAAIFMFEEYTEEGTLFKRVLHTGDFRSNPDMIREIQDLFPGTINDIYLDTTYLFPSYSFPLQREVVEKSADFAMELRETPRKKVQKSILSWALNKQPSKPFLFVVGTYSIGKEKLAIEIATRLETKIFIPAGSPKYHMASRCDGLFPPGMLTTNLSESCVHLVPLRCLRSARDVEEYFSAYRSEYDTLIGFIPTGWTFDSKSKWSCSHGMCNMTQEERLETVVQVLGNSALDAFSIDTLRKQYDHSSPFQIFKVPYPEHSSFKDLCLLGTSLRWERMIATVGLGDTGKIKDMEQWFKSWKELFGLQVQAHVGQP